MISKGRSTIGSARPTAASFRLPRATPAPHWQVESVGDFNNDGRDDIVWRNDEGTVIDWLGQASGGFADNSDDAFYQVADSWSVDGGDIQYGVTEIDARNDFNGDGRSDILLAQRQRAR